MLTVESDVKEMKLYTKLKTRLQILIKISGRVAVTASYSDTFYTYLQLQVGALGGDRCGVSGGSMVMGVELWIGFYFNFIR